jgi:mono/diheme cytochrome c family protein
MRRGNRVSGTVGLLAALMLLSSVGGVLIPIPAAAQTSSDQSVIYLNQAWSRDDREWFYNFSQGSAVLSYDIFLNLEIAGGQDLFRSDGNLARYGLIPTTANQYNPDALPIGISKTVIATAVKGWPVGDYVGLTCAACHEGQLDYKGKHVRIEGGISHTFDFQMLSRGLDDALQATLTDAAKFDRFAARLKASSADAKNNLRRRIEGEAVRVHEYATRTSLSPYPWGPGRIDALTMIMNRQMALLPDIPENTSTPIAPTKPPFLWNAPQGLWTQWAALLQDPISRNLGETVGVFLPIDLTSKTPEEGLFKSAAAIRELHRAEQQLQRLAPPSWPEDVFGKIDREKAKQGKALFMTLCSGCHNAWPYTWTEPNKYGKRFVLVGLVPQTYVGTDRTQFEAAKPFMLTGAVGNYLPGVLKGKPMLPTNLFFAVGQIPIRERALSQLRLTEAEQLDLHGYRELPAPLPPDRVYKAAPRDGVWATPPFLHNGSVPNLYEMLIPAAERTKQFYIGREFDPVKVGLDTNANAGPGAFQMDTTLLGNSNAGHSFQQGPRGNGTIGPLLSDEQRWALVEYLKSIPEEPGRVTPFGGPPAGP